MTEKLERNREAVALIPAAGAGKRMGEACPKQFLPLQGKPLLAHTLQLFQACSSIDHIYLVVPKGRVDFCQRELVERYGLNKVVGVVEGGEERQDSVYNGLLAIEASWRVDRNTQNGSLSLEPSICPEAGGFPEVVVVHDGARPFVSGRLIREILQAAKTWGAGVAALPCGDTLKEIDQGGVVLRTLDREKIWRVQTPQGFRYEVLKDALEEARQDIFYGTDEASLVERRGQEVRVIQGDSYNFKITTPADFLFGEWLLERGWSPDIDLFTR